MLSFTWIRLLYQCISFPHLYICILLPLILPNSPRTFFFFFCIALHCRCNAVFFVCFPTKRGMPAQGTWISLHFSNPPTKIPFLFIKKKTVCICKTSHSTCRFLYTVMFLALAPWGIQIITNFPWVYMDSHTSKCKHLPPHHMQF